VKDKYQLKIRLDAAFYTNISELYSGSLFQRIVTHDLEGSIGRQQHHREALLDQFPTPPLPHQIEQIKLFQKSYSPEYIDEF